MRVSFGDYVYYEQYETVTACFHIISFAIIVFKFTRCRLKTVGNYMVK